jgi:hypothetical protein
VKDITIWGSDQLAAESLVIPSGVPYKNEKGSYLATLKLSYLITARLSDRGNRNG